MISLLKTYFLWALGLFFLQVAVLNNLNAGKWIFPYPYVLLILFIPRTIPHWLLLIIGFLVGSLIDVYTHAYGTHAFACTLIAFIRPNLLNSIAPADSFKDDGVITIHNIGVQKFGLYALILLFVHHLFVFFIDEFSTQGFFILVSQVLTSSILSLFIILCLLFIFNKKGS